MPLMYLGQRSHEPPYPDESGRVMLSLGTVIINYEPVPWAAPGALRESNSVTVVIRSQVVFFSHLVGSTSSQLDGRWPYPRRPYAAVLCNHPGSGNELLAPFLSASTRIGSKEITAHGTEADGQTRMARQSVSDQSATERKDGVYQITGRGTEAST